MASTVTKDPQHSVPEQIILTANIYREDDDYVAECVEIGTVGQGKTFEAALRDLKDATELLLEEDPAALSQPFAEHGVLEEGIHDLEEAFDRHSGKVLPPANFHQVGTAQFMVEITHA